MSPRFASVALLGLLTAAVAALPAAPQLPPPVEAAIQQVTAAELRRTITALAGDDMEGRGVGHAGNQKAEQYIAGALREANVPPAAATYLQPVEVYQPRLGPNARLTVSGAGTFPRAALAVGSDFYPLPESADRAVTGRLIFAGHGITAPAAHHDDYAGLNAGGAIVCVLDDAPDALQGWPGLTSEEKIDIATLD